MFEKLLADLRAKRAAAASKIDALRAEGGVLATRDALSAEEQERSMSIVTELGEARSELAGFDAQIAQVEAERDADAEQQRAAEQRKPVNPAPAARVASEPNPVYRKGDTEVSYFRDLYGATTGAQDAIRRLADSQVRAASSAAGSGGEFAPPLWLVEDFVEIARAGRVTADLMQPDTLPEGVASVNLPKATGNTTPAVTQTQNTTITEGSFTSTSVSSGIAEISGKQTVPIALLRQSGVPLDRVILNDLARAYAAVLDGQVIAGSAANGQLRGLITAGTTVTYTTTQPTQASTSTTNSFYSKVLGAQAAMNGTRFLPADTLLMHPNRWLWVLNGYDTAGRPLIPPTANGQNTPGITGGPTAEGYAGTWAGLPVYVDPNIPTNLGAATNQDVAFVLRRDDLWLWESDMETASFDATKAEENAILYRVLGFAAFIPHRHQASVQVISGTGLVAPTF
ncbi:phage major capsid protein [Microbacterium schleiferi]|uniref:Phage major capsid protein n=1 Tax=Microbacterium schleiferi TaxID=69362 RepID=A0A7S8MY06_9MICO|nr:phage major capsid protein [Microbacterium schleiferi]QPE05307.1 phage major capsid protein [Microbacterium schleiferi]